MEPLFFLEQVSNGWAYGGCLRVRGFLLQVKRKVPRATGQQAVWTVAPVTRTEQPLARQRQVLVPVWRVVWVRLHNLLIQLPSVHKHRYTKQMLLQERKATELCLVWRLNLPHYVNSIVECLLRSDSQCKTAQRAELYPLPASLLPGQTERKLSSSWNKARKLWAKCWMDEPCRSTLTHTPLQWSDLCRCWYQTQRTRDAPPHKTGLWRCSSRLVWIVFINTLKYTTSPKMKEGLLHLACHISSLATRSHEAGWKLFTTKQKKKRYNKLQERACAVPLTINDYLCEYIVPLCSAGCVTNVNA